jgi:Protein kinase domain
MEFLSSTKTLVPKISQLGNSGATHGQRTKLLRWNFKIKTTTKPNGDRETTPSKLKGSIQTENYSSPKQITRKAAKSHTLSVAQVPRDYSERRAKAEKMMVQMAGKSSMNTNLVGVGRPIQVGKAGSRVVRPMAKLPGSQYMGKQPSASPQIRVAYNVNKQAHLGSQIDTPTAPLKHKQFVNSEFRNHLQKDLGSNTLETLRLDELNQVRGHQSPRQIIVVRRPGKIRTEPQVSNSSLVRRDQAGIESIFSWMPKAESMIISGASKHGHHIRIISNTIEDILGQPPSPIEEYDVLAEDTSQLMPSQAEDSVVSVKEPPSALLAPPHRVRAKHKTIAHLQPSSRGGGEEQRDVGMLGDWSLSEQRSQGKQYSRSPRAEASTRIADEQSGMACSRRTGAELSPSPQASAARHSGRTVVGNTGGRQERRCDSSQLREGVLGYGGTRHRLPHDKPVGHSLSPAPSRTDTDVGQAKQLYVSFKKRKRETEAGTIEEEIRTRRGLAEIKWSVEDCFLDVLKHERLKLGFRMGKGAFAEVFEGYDELLKRQVAIKIIDKKSGQDNQKIQRNIKQEVEMWKLVDKHEHVCEFYRLCEDNKKVSDAYHRYIWYLSSVDHRL